MVMSNGWLTYSAEPSGLLGDLGGLLYELLLTHPWLGVYACLVDSGFGWHGGQKGTSSAGCKSSSAGLSGGSAAGLPITKVLYSSDSQQSF